MSDPDPDPQPPPASWRDRVELLTQRPDLSVGRVAAGAVAVVVAAALVWLLVRPPGGPSTEDVLPLASAATAGPATTAAPPEPVLAHAAGAVVRPGVYRLPAGSRVADLIDAAGGPAPDADVDQLNLAAPVADGARVYVPRLGELVPTVAAVGGAPTVDSPLDLNAATLEQLDALPGIGPATARAILDERERRGGFRSVEDLLDVRGIGPAKLDALRDLVRV